MHGPSAILSSNHHFGYATVGSLFVVLLLFNLLLEKKCLCGSAKHRTVIIKVMLSRVSRACTDQVDAIDGLLPRYRWSTSLRHLGRSSRTLEAPPSFPECRRVVAVYAAPRSNLNYLLPSADGI